MNNIIMGEKRYGFVNKLVGYYIDSMVIGVCEYRFAEDYNNNSIGNMVIKIY